MKYRDENGIWQTMYLPPTGDTLPIGAEVDYDGEDVPYGWEEVEEPKDVYSTDEVKTNKVWIDGKPIYRKVYTGTIPSGTSQYTVGTITNFGESTSCFLKVYSSNGVEWIGYLTSSVSSGLQISPSGEMKIYETVTDTAPFKLVIEYTKTTDQGSGS